MIFIGVEVNELPPPTYTVVLYVFINLTLTGAIRQEIKLCHCMVP